MKFMIDIDDCLDTVNIGGSGGFGSSSGGSGGFGSSSGGGFGSSSGGFGESSTGGGFGESSGGFGGSSSGGFGESSSGGFGGSSGGFGESTGLYFIQASFYLNCRSLLLTLNPYRLKKLKIIFEISYSWALLCTLRVLLCVV